MTLRALALVDGWALALAAGLGLATLYFASALVGVLSTRLLASLSWGEPVDERKPPPGQRRREIRNSLLSIAIFSLYAPVMLWALNAGFIAFDWHAPWWKIGVDVILMFLWNEVHFYACHRVLHTRWLYRHVHHVHHASSVPTPFSTYSFHWFEALLLGSVMLTGLLFYPFHISVVVVLPVLSIVGNTFGHLHFDVVPRGSDASWVAAGRRHSLHHARARGNYGFLSSALDRVFGTALR